MSTALVWFKRDLRVEDHAALAAAARHGDVVCVYVVEPAMWAQDDASAQHYAFVRESLRDLDVALRALGGRLVTCVGDIPEVFGRLHASLAFDALFSHQETGNAPTFSRDREVARWCRAHGVAWHQFPQFGVVRGLRDRDGWHRQWRAHVTAPKADHGAVRFAQRGIACDELPTAAELGLADGERPHRQSGGRDAGRVALASFLAERSGSYRGGISSPLSAPTACSRLSPYLAQGCLSLREIVQATRETQAQLGPGPDPRRRGLAAFVSRLHWHCHFIQKFESEPEIEFHNMHRGYDGLRESDWRQEHFDALVAGRTGWPLVDACVAMLRETGWLNFRMRAMLVSTAAYPLWLHWRPVGLWLAREFLDYEPGIHWSQVQMQSGTTGINTARIYNPIKQARDHDPQGEFVRRWLPAMRRVPQAWLFEPWLMPEELQRRCGVRVGEDIPMPVVDLAAATREAKHRLYSLRARPEVRAEAQQVVARHGSRRKPATPPRRAGPARGQLALDL